MSLGLTMFFKALVVTLWGIFVESWKALKERHSKRGLELRLDRKTGIYVPYSPFEHVEKWARRGFIAVLIVGIPYMILVLYILFSTPASVFRAG